MLECLRMVKKYILTCISMVITVVLVGCLIILLDEKIQEHNKKGYPQSGKYQITVDIFGPDYSAYLRNGKAFDDYCDLYEELNTDFRWKYVSEDELYAKVESGDVPQECFREAEERSGGMYDGYVKVILATEDFVKEHGIVIDKGQLFSGYTEYEISPCPVWLGGLYENTCDINDLLSIDIDGIVYPCYVAGFISQESCYYSETENRMISCDNAVFVPHFYNMENNRECRDFLERYFNGIIYSDLSYEEVNNAIDNLQSKYNISSLTLIDTDPTKRFDEWSSRHSKMSGQIARSLERITWAIVIGAAGVLGMLLTTVMRREMYNLGIYMLCGRSYKHIVGIILSFVTLLLLVSDFVLIGICQVSEAGVSAYVKIHAMLIILWTLSSLGSTIVTQKNDIVSFVGGKE